ncbi:hypothetical protein KIL84_007179 [Mauremys mutica]|uniref:Uncharacterized protein n=1 Tax=Mauremys mutica TaxID=74926 RepID=A0A9D3X1D6_9SAUR|nr:hypothetical protein KIL84_007179 [Mauremys mutica]
MAAGPGAEGALDLQFQIQVEQSVCPAGLTEQQASAGPEPDAGLERSGRLPIVVQSGTIGELLRWVAPQQARYASQKEMLQHWEDVWQEVLQAMRILPEGLVLDQIVTQLNCSAQALRWNGFSPEWFLRCICRAEVVRKLLPHLGQGWHCSHVLSGCGEETWGSATFLGAFYCRHLSSLPPFVALTLAGTQESQS